MQSREGGKGPYMAHRLSYEAFCGPIPDGMYVMHKCDVPSCINPDHLCLGSHQDNMADRNAKKRHAHGNRHGKARLTEDAVRFIRRSDETDESLAARFGVAPPTVNQARHRRYWKHVA